MSSGSLPYPFEPKSSRDLVQGHYWCVPLSDGRHAVGVMLAHAMRLGKRDRSNILVGLLDRVGDGIPAPHDLLEAKVLQRAFMHVRSIESCGSMVAGRAERDWGPEEVDFALAGSKIPGWGLLAMQYHAELRWGDARRMQQRLKAGMQRKSGA